MSTSREMTIPAEVAGDGNPREDRAKARLIDAAPDLLRALKELLADMEEWGVDMDTEAVDAARAAIAKATST